MKNNFIFIATFKSLPNIIILDWSKLKGFADDNINVTQTLKFVLGMIENILGKEKMGFWMCGKELIKLRQF